MAMRLNRYSFVKAITGVAVLFLLSANLCANLLDDGEISEALPNDLFEAFVSYVLDGDSIEVIYQNDSFRLRLIGIDAPEKDQVYGAKATKILYDLISKQSVTVRVFGKDRYDRWLAHIWIDNLNVNLSLIRKGAAWCYFFATQSKSKIASECNQIQQQARQSTVGLWESENPIKPWVWRAGKKADDQYVQEVFDEGVSKIMTLLASMVKKLSIWIQSL